MNSSILRKIDGHFQISNLEPLDKKAAFVGETTRKMSLGPKKKKIPKTKIK